MPTTHEQKADIGLRYITEIKRRIDVRTKAQESAAEECRSINTTSDCGFGCAEMEKIARKAANHHRFKATGARVETIYIRGGHHDFLKIYGPDGSKVVLPIECRPDLSGIKALCKRRDNAQNKKRELCHEIELLNKLLGPSSVASFQAHASRLWAPNAKDDLMPEALFKSTLDDFLMGKRPAVCAA